jgi:hypothetical protein
MSLREERLPQYFRGRLAGEVLGDGLPTKALSLSSRSAV